MLNRQRAILSLLREAGGEASHLCVTKWAFLLREECPSRGGPAFYQFLPYRKGPFSFCLFQEAAALTRDGYITDAQGDWKLSRAGISAANRADAAVQADIGRLMRAHANKPVRELIDYVYGRFPWFTVNSEISQREQRTDADVAVYTAGYEGMLVDGFLDGLMRSGIRRLIDVRNNPVSRRYGFHKSTLARLCEKLSIDYVHFPELGIASEHRQDLDHPGARQTLFDTYERTTLAAQGSAIAVVGRLVQERPSILVCMEACHTQCHRSRLARAVAAATGLRTHHLEFRP